MADFCKQCSIDTFTEDFGDMQGLCKEDEMVHVLCEGCGPCIVDSEGKCICIDCLKKHGNEND